MPPVLPQPGRGGEPRLGLEVPGPPATFAQRPIYYGIYVETGKGSEIFHPAPDVLSHWTISEGFNETETTLTLKSDGLNSAKISQAGQIGLEHFAQLLALLHPTRRIVIAGAFNTRSPQILFRGYPMSTDIAWSSQGQTLVCTCVSEGDEILTADPKHQCLGTPMRRHPWMPWDAAAPDQLAIVDAVPLAYNPGGIPNRSSEPVSIQTPDGRSHDIYLHVDPQRKALTASEDTLALARAEYWTFAEALRNLLYVHSLRVDGVLNVDDFFRDTDNVPTQPGTTKDPFMRAMGARVDNIVCAPMSLREALVRLCSSAGLYFYLPVQRPKGRSMFAPVLRVLARIRDEEEEQNSKARNMLTPSARDLPREAPFTDTADRTATDIALKNKAGYGCDLSGDARMCNAPIFIGEPKLYETTLLFRPGWLPDSHLDNLVSGSTSSQDAAFDFWVTELETDTDDDGQIISAYHNQHPNHFSVSDVARLWVFPDDLAYYPMRGYARETWDDELYSPLPAPLAGNVLADGLIGGGIAEASAWVPRRRPLGDTIGRRTKSDDHRAPIVRIAFDMSDPRTALTDATWREYTGGVRFDTQRCALRFTNDNLFTDPGMRQFPDDDEDAGAMFRALIEGRFAVAVTCTIVGDDRLRYRAADPARLAGSRERTRLIDVGRRFAYRNRRGQNSYLNDKPPIIAPDEARYENRDDTVALTDYGDRQRREMEQVAMSGRFSVPWIDNDRTRGGYLLGDAFSGAAGIGVEFDGFPAIVTKQYAKSATGYSTTYHLGDLRLSPDVGVTLFVGADDSERGGRR